MGDSINRMRLLFRENSLLQKSKKGKIDDLLDMEKPADPVDAYLSSHSLSGSATEQKSAREQAEDYKPWHLSKLTASEPAHIAMPLAANSGEGQVVDIKLDSELQESFLQKGKTGHMVSIKLYRSK